ncbi:MAG: flagellar hook-length control protein FliK [Hyphomonadaceae bacterium]
MDLPPPLPIDPQLRAQPPGGGSVGEADGEAFAAHLDAETEDASSEAATRPDRPSGPISDRPSDKPRVRAAIAHANPLTMDAPVDITSPTQNVENAEATNAVGQSQSAQPAQQNSAASDAIDAAPALDGALPCAVKPEHTQAISLQTRANAALPDAQSAAAAELPTQQAAGDPGVKPVQEDGAKFAVSSATPDTQAAPKDAASKAAPRDGQSKVNGVQASAPSDQIAEPQSAVAQSKPDLAVKAPPPDALAARQASADASPVAQAESLRAGREHAADAARLRPLAQRAKPINGGQAAQQADARQTGAAQQPQARASAALAALPQADVLAQTSNLNAASTSIAIATAGVSEPGAAQQDANAAAQARTATPAAQVAQHIIRRVQNGAANFEVRLDPPELGRIEVKLEMTSDHRVSAAIAADDPATLSQLARASREIIDALQSAGLQVTEDGLRFDLADRGGEHAAARESSPVGRAASEPTENTPITRQAVLEHWRGARVDLVA